MIRALIVRILSLVFESTTLRKKIMITWKVHSKSSPTSTPGLEGKVLGTRLRAPLSLVHSHSVPYGRFKRKNFIIEEGKARVGQFPAYFLLLNHTRTLFILFLKYQQGPLRETEAWRDGPLNKLMGGWGGGGRGRSTKKYSRKGKLNEKKISCTPINPKKKIMLWPKKNS